LRHGQTDKASDSSVSADMSRNLTCHGRQQASAASSWLASLEALPRAGQVGLICSSSASRCQDTVALATDHASDVQVLAGIYDGVNVGVCREAFSQVGHASTAAYIARGFGPILRDYGARVLLELALALDACEARNCLPPLWHGVHTSGKKLCGTVVVCGHAVFSAAAAAMLADILVPPHSNALALSVLSAIVHGEADGLLVSMYGVGYLASDPTSLTLEAKEVTEQTLSLLAATPS